MATAIDTRIPAGCGSLWNAAAPGLNIDHILAQATRKAERGVAQAVIMPSGETIIISPAAA